MKKKFFYRTRENKLLQYFDNKGSFLYCYNIPDPLIERGILQYSPENWRLFSDSSEQSMKCVLYIMEISMTPSLTRWKQRRPIRASKSFWS